MSLFPLQPATQAEVYILGDVQIDPSAAIAPGVILQAAPDCQITIAAGACLGMGTIICASYGDVAVEAGVILGAGVLILGQATVGANSCIGAATTIYNTTVEPMQFVQAGTVLGDTSREVKFIEQVEEEGTATTAIPPEPQTQSQTQTPSEPPPPETPAVTPDSPESTQNGQTPAQPLAQKPQPSQVYGREQVNQMLLSLFPHRRDSPNGASPGS